MLLNRLMLILERLRWTGQSQLYQRIELDVYLYKPPLHGCGTSSIIPLSTYQIRKCRSDVVVQPLKSYRARELVATGARASAIISDMLVLTVTLYQAYKIYGPGRQEGAVPLSKFLYRDGSVYFAVLFLFNLCDIIFLQLAINGALADLVTVLSTTKKKIGTTQTKEPYDLSR
ncbi:hypothetical protein VTO73DRAFT_10630 [Trametes versicolor]